MTYGIIVSRPIFLVRFLSFLGCSFLLKSESPRTLLSRICKNHWIIMIENILWSFDQFFFKNSMILYMKYSKIYEKARIESIGNFEQFGVTQLFCTIQILYSNFYLRVWFRNFRLIMNSYLLNRFAIFQIVSDNQKG